jgi:putative ABC transport system permease protein
MAFLAVFIYCGICGEWLGLQKAADEYYARTNLADVWVYSQSGFDEDALRRVEALQSVTAAERRAMVEVSAELAHSPKIETYILEKNEISMPYLSKGGGFDINSDGIWLDARFADANGLAVGGEITLVYGGFPITKSIEGLVYSPEYVFMENDTMYSDVKNKGFAFMSAKAVSFPGFFYSQLLIKADTDDCAALEKDISDALDGKYGVFITRDRHTSYNQFAMEIEQHKAMGAVFPIVFALVAILTLLTTMARLSAAQRTQIGTLKALGFSKKKIVFHYLSYGFLVSLAGAVFGAVAGPIVLPPLFYPSLSAFYTLPAWEPAYDISFYLIAAFTVACCTLAAYLTTREVLSLAPAESLRPRELKILKQKNGAAPKLWQKLGFNLQWNLRDAGRNKTRSAMATVGALGCTALLIAAFGMYNDMADTKVWQYEQIYRFETKITLTDVATYEQANNIAVLSDGEFIMENAVEIRSGGVKYTGSLLVTDGGNLIAFTDENRKEITLPENGVSVSHKMAELLGVGVGDTAEWRLFGSESYIECTVAGIYRAPMTQGLTMSRETFENFGGEFRPSAVVSAEYFDEKLEGANHVLHSSDMSAGWDELTESFMLMIYILVFAAVLLAAVVMYNLGVLSFTEMQREFATLKVLGFKTSRLRSLMLTQNLILTFIGFLTGIPFGVLLVDVVIASMGDSFDIIVALHPSDVAISALIIAGTAAVVNLLFSGKLRKIDMVSTLKSVE